MTAMAIGAAMDDMLTLDTLSNLNTDELDALYRKGTVPAKVDVLNGSPEGRMLAVKGVDKTPLFGVVTSFAKSAFFPWGGKNFQAISDMQGEGINRINLLVSRQQWYPFKILVVRSMLDGKGCIYLDYDLPQNPWFIRKIRDELREVSPGLFLGPAMWKDNHGGASVLLWFALDTNAA